MIYKKRLFMKKKVKPKIAIKKIIQKMIIKWLKILK